MPLSVREAPKLWRKICAETSIELSLLAENWKFILGGLIFQQFQWCFICGLNLKTFKPVILSPCLRSWNVPNFVCTKMIEIALMTVSVTNSLWILFFSFGTYMDWLLKEFIICIDHDELYRILGFFFFQWELGQGKAYVSEVAFTFLFVSFVMWTFHPFVFQIKKIYTVLIWCRVLAYLVVSQMLRIVTFFATQLPGPNYHCREGSSLSTLPLPENPLALLLVNLHGVTYGCGDLIFSSHMIFTLSFVHTYHKYGSKRCMKQLAWLLAVIQSLLIIASRKHYTVDVVVAWYTVNLVAFFVDRKLPELPDRTSGSPSPPLLPLSTKG